MKPLAEIARRSNRSWTLRVAECGGTGIRTLEAKGHLLSRQAQ